MSAPTQYQADQDVVERFHVDEQRLGPVLVATDGTPESDDAIVLARELATSAAADLHAISVCEDVLPIAEMPRMFPPASSLEDPDFTRARRRTRVNDQLRRLLGRGHGTRIVVRSGSVGSGIASYATEHACELIVAGRGRHGRADRLLGEEHMLRLLRATRRPVLLAEPGMRAIPRRVVVGLDFSQRDRAVVEIARTIMAPDAKVFLVHVRPDIPYAVPTSGSWVPSQREALRRRMESAAARFSFGRTHEVAPVILAGHPGKSLADFARRVRADVLAVGIHGLGFIHRLVIGSATAYLVRTAACSILAAAAVPERDAL